LFQGLKFLLHKLIASSLLFFRVSLFVQLDQDRSKVLRSCQTDFSTLPIFVLVVRSKAVGFLELEKFARWPEFLEFKVQNVEPRVRDLLRLIFLVAVVLNQNVVAGLRLSRDRLIVVRQKQHEEHGDELTQESEQLDPEPLVGTALIFSEAKVAARAVSVSEAAFIDDQPEVFSRGLLVVERSEGADSVLCAVEGYEVQRNGEQPEDTLLIEGEPADIAEVVELRRQEQDEASEMHKLELRKRLI
jgi:hypothetical protein